MHLRRVLLLNVWLQLFLVLAVVILANAWGAQRFFRLDVTADKRYTLDLVTRALMYKLDKPLYAKVYFTDDLQTPYNNHEQIVTDKLEELRAYSRGLLKIEVVDPGDDKALRSEAARFGVQPIQYRYRSANVRELKQVYMGVALVYGDRQQVLPAITSLSTLEYELARAIRNLVDDADPKTIGYLVGHGEPDLLEGQGPLGILRDKLRENYDLVSVEADGNDGVPEAVDALFIIGPQRPVSERALYHIDQFLMRGGSLAVFVTNTKPDLRNLRARNVYHGMESLLAHYGVQANRDIVYDRRLNGQMSFPVQQGRTMRQVKVNYPLIPKTTQLNADSLVVKDLESMLFPFVSSLTVADPLPLDVTASVLAEAMPDSSRRIQGLRAIQPALFTQPLPEEETGPFPLLVSLTGKWTSFFADKNIPLPEPGAVDGPVRPDNPASKARDGVDARLVVSGSADFVANNIAFMLNLADWMVQEEALIQIRTKAIEFPPLEPMEPQQTQTLKLLNLLAGPILLLIVGVGRWLIRRRA